MVLWSKAILRRNGRGIAAGLKLGAIPLHAGTLGMFSAWQFLRGTIKRGSRFSTASTPEAVISTGSGHVFVDAIPF